jgi:hypothetical protein
MWRREEMYMKEIGELTEGMTKELELEKKS